MRHEKRGIATRAFLMPHCPVTVVQRYRDGVCSLLFHLFFMICHPYIPRFFILVYCVLFIATDECGSSVGPGARKPSVGEGIQSRRLLVLTLFCGFSFFSFLHLFLVCVSNNNNEYKNQSSIVFVSGTVCIYLTES